MQEKIRCIAAGAIQKARANGLPLIEVEFPPLLGGRNAKRQTDDYSNIEVVTLFRPIIIIIMLTTTTMIS